jgi:hypothetical protein
MTTVVAESRDPEEAKKRFKTWLQNNPEIAKDLKPTDVVLEAARVEGGTLFRYQVNIPPK